MWEKSDQWFTSKLSEAFSNLLNKNVPLRNIDTRRLLHMVNFPKLCRAFSPGISCNALPGVSAPPFHLPFSLEFQIKCRMPSSIWISDRQQITFNINTSKIFYYLLFIWYKHISVLNRALLFLLWERVSELHRIVGDTYQQRCFAHSFSSERTISLFI